MDQEKFEQERNAIAAMSFPSILESLVTGIKGKKTKSESTISEGFDAAKLAERKTMLTYQHRMHPQISEFHNPNRLNAAITRVKFQLVIFGKYEYFSKKARSEDLRALALLHENHTEKWEPP